MKKSEDAALLGFLSQLKTLKLAEMRLLSSECKLGKLQKGKLPPQVRLETNVNVLRKDGDPLQPIVVVTAYSMFSGYDDEPKAETAAVTIRARFGLQYKHDGVKTDEKLGDAAAHLAVLNSWPYWREFVHSMSIRMGLPPITIPITNISELTAEDGQKTGKRPAAKAKKK